MSEDEFYTGKLRRVYQGDDLEGFAKSYVISMGWECDEYYDAYWNTSRRCPYVIMTLML
jgi:hypothetical protein